MSSGKRDLAFVIGNPSLSPYETKKPKQFISCRLLEAIEKVLSTASIHSASIPGTSKYFRSNYYQFQALTLF